MLGFVSDLRRENDWFRTMLGGRSVFVQRFRDGLRGFENRCAHRSFPLRNAERGHGPVICGFHHWRYDADGIAAGIPNCQDAFGCKPRELGIRLTRLELATCGDLIFGRFPDGGSSLEQALGPAFEVIAALCPDLSRAARAVLPMRANWRLLQWISLDDYHLAAVHPGTFGRKSLYVPRKHLNYVRVGPHSAYFLGEASGTMADWLARLRGGGPDPVMYRILNLFPDSSILITHPIRILGIEFRYLVIFRAIALAHDRSEVSVRVLRWQPEGSGRSLASRLVDLGEPARRLVARRVVMHVLQEDQAICERLQAEAQAIAPDPRLGAAEPRVGWFNEAYADIMRGAAPPP
ncbi:MAG: Rieske 2Fe-2S domain-containing protein [Roseomonas sp.]|nr:Rieske 2Fe-2S domain-containing protein [Cupriavidus sp.]MCA3279331.1 Rieske 2Fe-2S domain-containing protein [Roseomonas sp.]